MGILQSACGWLAAAIITAAATPSFSQTESSVESTRAVASPDGKRTVVVDRFSPVVDGQAERFSGRMMLRVTSNDGLPARQRYIEASQARVIQPPVWLEDSGLCAFVYNVAKNSNGIVYFEPATNRAVQVEFVMPARHMAASGQIEQELTSLEITEFTESETLKTRNIPWKGGSAFPLVIQPLPRFEGQPYGLDFYRQINAALGAYRDFLQKNSLEKLELEQASESFSADEKWLGLLACSPKASWALSVPLSMNDPAQVLSGSKAQRLADIPLSCSQTTDTQGEMPIHDSRFLTGWKGSATLLVLQETYDTESDEPITTPIREVNVNSGAVSDLATTASVSAAPSSN